jgi:hypothetical protein
MHVEYPITHQTFTRSLSMICQTSVHNDLHLNTFILVKHFGIFFMVNDTLCTATFRILVFLTKVISLLWIYCTELFLKFNSHPLNEKNIEPNIGYTIPLEESLMAFQPYCIHKFTLFIKNLD